MEVKEIKCMLTITNIKSLVQAEPEPRKWVAGSDMALLPCIENAFLCMENGAIRDFGPMSSLSPDYLNGRVVDASGRLVLPSYCDSHTHLVYAGSRELEYVDKIKGLSYIIYCKMM